MPRESVISKIINGLVYVEYYNSVLFRKNLTRKVILPTGEDLTFILGRKINKVVKIPYDPIKITFVDEEKFITNDGAEIQLKASMMIAPKPSLNEDNSLQHIGKYLDLYEKNNLDIKLKELLSPALLKILNSCSFREIKDLKISLNDNVNDDLLTVLENEAEKVLKDKNFSVERNSCQINLSYAPITPDEIKEEEEKVSPNRLPIVIYWSEIVRDAQYELKTIKKIKDDTLRDLNEAIEKAKGEATEKLQKIGNQSKEKIDELNKEHRTKIDEIENFIADLDAKKEIAARKRESDNATSFASIAKEKIRAENDLATEEQGKEMHKIKLDVNMEKARVESKIKLSEELSESYQKIQSNYYSLDGLLQLKALELQKEVAQKQEQIDAIAFNRKHMEEDRVINKTREKIEIEHKHKMDEITTNLLAVLLQRLYEREIVLGYHHLNTNQQHKLIITLGEQLANIMKEGKGVVDSLKIVNFSGGESDIPLTKLLVQVAETLFKTTSFVPTLADMLKEFSTDIPHVESPNNTLNKQTTSNQNTENSTDNYRYE